MPTRGRRRSRAALAARIWRTTVRGDRACEHARNTLPRGGALRRFEIDAQSRSSRPARCTAITGSPRGLPRRCGGAPAVPVRHLTRERCGRDGVSGSSAAVLLLLVAPVALFVFMADPSRASSARWISYEEGQAVAAAELVRDGAFPWRDLCSSPWPAARRRSGRSWASGCSTTAAGGSSPRTPFCSLPLAWVALYYLCAYLFWTNWLVPRWHAAPDSSRGIVSADRDSAHSRPGRAPAARGAARKSRPRRARSPSRSLARRPADRHAGGARRVVAALATLAAFEFSTRERGTGLVARLSEDRALPCGGAGHRSRLVRSSSAAFRALDDWVFSFAATIPGHRLTGGIPLLVPRTRVRGRRPGRRSSSSCSRSS